MELNGLFLNLNKIPRSGDVTFDVEVDDLAADRECVDRAAIPARIVTSHLSHLYTRNLSVYLFTRLAHCNCKRTQFRRRW